MELWLASQEITSSRLRREKKENSGNGTTSEDLPKEIITKENGSYLNNSDCISSTTFQQEEAMLESNCVGDAGRHPNQVRLRSSAETDVSSTTSLTPSCQTGKSKDL